MTWTRSLVDKGVKIANSLRICLLDSKHISNILNMFQKIQSSMSMIEREIEDIKKTK